MAKAVKEGLKIVISLVLIGLLLRIVNWREIAVELTRANLWWFVPAFVFFQIGVAIRAYRWQGLLRASGVDVPLAVLVRWYFVGSLFNTVLPTSFGGDVVKTYALARYSSRPGVSLGSVLVDRFSGIAILMLTGVVVLVLAPGAVSTAVHWMLWGLFAACVLAVLFMARRDWALALQRRLPILARARLGQVLLDAVPDYGLRPLLTALLVSTVFNTLLVLINLCLGRAVGIDVSLNYYLLFVPLISISLVLPAFGGLGVRELTYVGLFAQVGVAASTATAMSLLFYICMIGAALIGAVYYLLPEAPANQPAPLVRAPER